MQGFIGKKLSLMFSFSFEKCQLNKGFRISIKCITQFFVVSNGTPFKEE